MRLGEGRGVGTAAELDQVLLSFFLWSSSQDYENIRKIFSQ